MCTCRRRGICAECYNNALRERIHVQVVQKTASVLVTLAVVDLAALSRAHSTAPCANVKRSVFFRKFSLAVV
jgi:hypothetical protein